MPEFQTGNDDTKAALVVTQRPHFPTLHTRELVEHLTACGLNEAQIAIALKCSTEDVRRYYASEMEHALTMVNSRVKARVLHQALYEGDMQAAKLWLINNANWRAGDGNKVGVGVSFGADGTPLQPGELTVVQRREIISTILTRAVQQKREGERVIEGTAVAVKKNGNGSNGHGTNGNGSNGANGHNGGGNGKHK